MRWWWCQWKGMVEDELWWLFTISRFLAAYIAFWPPAFLREKMSSFAAPARACCSSGTFAATGRAARVEDISASFRFRGESAWEILSPVVTVTTQGRKPKAKTPTHRGKKLGNIFTPSVQQSIATFKILLHQDPLPRLPGSFRADSISFRKSRNEHFVVPNKSWRSSDAVQHRHA